MFDSSVPPGIDYISSLYFINSNTGWSTGQNDLISFWAVSKTTDGGLNWIFTQIFSSTYNINSVFCIGSLYGWLGSPAGPPFGVYSIYKTTNGGMNWISSPNGIQANSLFFINRNKGWAASNNGSILITENSGTNWTNQTASHPGISYHSIYFSDSLTGWAVGDSGTILKTTTGGVLTNFINTETEIPDRYFLSQNYPNPFNPKTIIKYKCSIFNFVTLKVYDVLGNEIRTLVNENKPPGNYRVEFDGADYPSGIYFYRLEVNGNIIDTKRMLLIK